jgi:hypothetical protein
MLWLYHIVSLVVLLPVFYFITFMVLYSIIKPYHSFFVINRHIARQDFILNDLFSSGRNPGKMLKFSSQTFSTSVAMTSHNQKVAHKFYKRKQNANINLYTLNFSLNIFLFAKYNKYQIGSDTSFSNL